MKTRIERLARCGQAVGIALLVLLCAGNATAGEIALSPPVADEATLFGVGGAIPKASTFWEYTDPTYEPTIFFQGKITSTVYWALGGPGSADDKTYVIYEIDHYEISSPSSPLDQFNIDDVLVVGAPLEIVNIAGGGVIGGGPAPDKLTTLGGPINIIQFDWFTDPLDPGDSTKVYLAYDGLWGWASYNGKVQDTIVRDRDLQVVLSVVQAPEPALGIALGIGLLGIARTARKRIRRKSNTTR